MQELSNQTLTSSDEHPRAMDSGEIESGDVVVDRAVQGLKDELAKWQERVPKLASALRERTRQADKLQAEVDQLRDSGDVGEEAGLQAREQLINELEARLKALNSKLSDSQGQLHSRDMEITALRQDIDAWQDKLAAQASNFDEQQVVEGDVSALNAALEEKSRTLEERDHELTLLRDETASLTERNAKLFETTELANRQIETLGDNLTQLRDQVREKDDALRGVSAELESNHSSQVGHDDLLRSRDADLESLHQRIESMQSDSNNLKTKLAGYEEQISEYDALREAESRVQSELNERTDEVNGLADRLAQITRQHSEDESEHESQAQLLAEKDEIIAKLSEARDKLEGEARGLDKRLVEEHGEIERLEQSVANAERGRRDWEAERGQLSAQLGELQQRNDHLEGQLNERSNLVMGLEQETASSARASEELVKGNDQLSQALAKAERHASEHAEHITQLDARLDRNKEHMVELEQELAEVRGEAATAYKASTKALAHKQTQVSELTEELEVSSRVIEHADPAGDAAHEELVAKMELLEEQVVQRTEAAEKAEAAINELEAKLAQVKAQSQSAGSDSEAVELLQEEVHKLEQMVRDRTEQLNKVHWQQNMTERSEDEGIGGDNKMLMVLNQQLSDARESNDRLVAQVRELEAQLAGVSSSAKADDLTAIKGIGPKVAAQLTELGVTGYSQIAELDKDDLADELHVLHLFKKRIEKDSWIVQARELLQS